MMHNTEFKRYSKIDVFPHALNLNYCLHEQIPEQGYCEIDSQIHNQALRLSKKQVSCKVMYIMLIGTDQKNQRQLNKQAEAAERMCS